MQLVVCTGGDCRRAKGFDEVVELARSSSGGCTVACQGICHGPVVGLRRPGRSIRWYERVRRKRMDVLRDVLATGRGRKRLRSSEVRSKRGRLRHPRRLRPMLP